MSDEERVISKDEYDTAFRLFAAARAHYAKAAAIEGQIAKTLGIMEFSESHVADLMFTPDVTDKKFRRALSRERIIVESP